MRFVEAHALREPAPGQVESRRDGTWRIPCLESLQVGRSLLGCRFLEVASELTRSVPFTDRPELEQEEVRQCA